MSRESAKVLVAKLHGKRITLRPPRSADYAEYAELMKLSQPFFRGLVGKFNGKKQFNEYVQRCEREDYYGFLICDRETGALLGGMNLFHFLRRGMQSVTLGYFIGAPHMRQGYATEALQVMLRFAFGRLKLHRIEADIQPHNRPSIALVKRAGFTCEGYSRRLVKISGTWRDHERWALLAEDWRANRRRKPGKSHCPRQWPSRSCHFVALPPRGFALKPCPNV